LRPQSSDHKEVSSNTAIKATNKLTVNMMAMAIRVHVINLSPNALTLIPQLQKFASR
jgi:hypothetical protein